MMQILNSTEIELDWEERVSILSRQPLIKPFEQLNIDFVEAISKRILLEKSSRVYPELIAMAHWLRKSHLLELKEQFGKIKHNRIWLARGTTLHFAPANVDTIFMYSWLLSLLVGNNNIIRLSTRGSEQVEILLKIIHDLLKDKRFQLLSYKNILIRYTHNNKITETLSNYCDVRIIWGGDQSVKNIRCVPLPAYAKEIVFANRFSMAALDARTILSDSEKSIQILAHKFYNDAFWFNQLACSSPRLILWIGDEATTNKAKIRFWEALEQYCKSRNEKIDAAIQMVRLTQIFEYAASNQIAKQFKLLINSGYCSHVPINQITDNMRERHRGGQLFLEFDISNLLEAAHCFTKKDQTLSVYGFTHKDALKLIESLPHRAIDRVVPIGEALNFQPTWDGYSLFQELTREVTLNI